MALILALILGAVGVVAAFGTFSYAQWRLRQGLAAEQRREGNRSIGVALLFWVAAALLVKGMVLIAGLLFGALAITVALWLRKTLASLRARAPAGRGRDAPGGTDVDRIPSRSSGPRTSTGSCGTEV